jgi:phage replication-related protein YjqB (UPF0714/DUF867 family)
VKRVLPAIALSVAALTSCTTAPPPAPARPASTAHAVSGYYAERVAHAVEGRDYRRVTRFPAGAKVAQIAIHGGAIEAPTAQLADAAAEESHSAFYSFQGLMKSGNNRLHITSTQFDDPEALKLVGEVDYTVSWHGAAGKAATTYVGGLDTTLIKKITFELRKAGFTVAASVPKKIRGDSPRNIANRNRRGMGVQLEISRGQREAFFSRGRLTRSWVEDPAHRTRAFYRYVSAIDRALS